MAGTGSASSDTATARHTEAGAGREMGRTGTDTRRDARRTGDDTRHDARRTGADTRREAQRVARELFTTRGYDATSLREIAAALGINKASLYYYFDSKEAILRSLFDERGAETEELIDWLHDQPADPVLLRTAVLRWVDSFSAEKLQGIRFVTANPLLSHRAGAEGGDRIGSGLTRLADELTRMLPTDTPRTRLLLRMAILSINAAVIASAGTDIPDDEVIRAAHDAAEALLREL